MSRHHLSLKSESEYSVKNLPKADDHDGIKNNLEHLENRLSIEDFSKMQTLFMSPELNKPGFMTREEFVKQSHMLIGHGKKQEYGELFDKIDVTRDGFIDWDKLTSFMLLELYEKDERAKSSAVPQWKDIRLLSPIHKDAIQKIVFLKGSGRYLTLSRDGLLGVWGENLKLQRTLRITTESVKPKDLWVTSLVSLANVNKIAVAFTSKEIVFYDLNSKQEFVCLYKLQGLDATPICVHYWSNPEDGNEGVLTFGDVAGQVQAIIFTTALISLFEKPANSTSDQETTMNINWHELVSGHHKCCYVLRHNLHENSWVRQVAFSGSLEAFLSCTTGGSNTMVLAWVERRKDKLRTVHMNISQGINAFDYHAGLNLIATAGVDHKVCLWNPYVVSKPTGILQGNMASVLAVQFMVGRKQLLSFSKDKVLRIWDVHHQLCIQRIANIFPKSLEFQLVFYFYEAHRRLFIAFNGHLTMLEVKQEAGKKVTSHEKSVTCVLYNSVFKQVISSDTGSTVHFFMIDTGQKVKQFNACHGKAEISTMALDATETRLLTGSTDGTVKIWDFNGHCHYKLNAGGNQAAEISQILVLKRTILVLGWERIITVFRMNTLTQFFVQPAEWKGGVQHQDDILCAAFLPPQSLVTGSYDGEIVVWNNSTENASRKLHHDSKRASKSKSVGQIQQQSGVRSLSSSFTGRRSLPAGGFYDSDADSNNAVTRLFFLEARKNLSATGGANLVSCGGSGYVRFWNIFTCQLMAEFAAHNDMGSIIMTIDKASQYLITADLDGWVKIWNIQDYCIDFSEVKEARPPPLVKAFQPHDDCVTHLETLVHDGHLLVISASADCTVCLSTIHGSKVGTFGQEEHWQIKDFTTLPEAETTLDGADVTKQRTPSLLDQNLSSANFRSSGLAMEDGELPYMISPWENTILGKQYKESNMKKEKPHPFYSEETVHNSIGTFSALSIGALQEVVDVSKPDFVLHPERYFGERPEQRTSSNEKLPTLAETLKAVFDEKSLFPKDILEREKKAKQRREELYEGKLKMIKKTRKLSEK
ncbi:cilia- and flagella-associated protein 337 [Ambystoma mexicanum]|uniref:cilia- and flagella-associated protein 337 n=1 Tax=Ambystoma mexicanum TaxID=8296 RepID=UPI0037E7B8F2